MRRAYHETVLELSRLDDKVLRDINVMRDDIPRIARRAAERAVTA
jgi:uncharacterized protein YjiS (DUF1127 family)